MRKYAVMAAASALLAAPATAAAQAQPQQCPVVVTNTTLQADCVGPMVVAGNDLTVNLGTHSVICPPLGGSANPFVNGIEIHDRTNVHVTNGHVHQCRRGIDVVRGGSHKLTHLHNDRNFTGVSIRESEGNVLSNMDMIENEQYGVLFDEGSTNNRVDAGLRIVENRSAGIAFENGSHDNRVAGALIHEAVSSAAAGIQVINSDRIRVTGSRLFGTPQSSGGIILLFSTGSVIRSNTAEGFTEGGITLGLGATGTLVEANHLRHNERGGVVMALGSSRTHVHDNQAVDNDRAGIEAAFGSTDNLIEDNLARGNGTFDLEDGNPNCDANVWRNNDNVTENQPACID
jgi:hypothetical protein